MNHTVISTDRLAALEKCVKALRELRELRNREEAGKFVSLHETREAFAHARRVLSDLDATA